MKDLNTSLKLVEKINFSQLTTEEKIRNWVNTKDAVYPSLFYNKKSGAYI